MNYKKLILSRVRDYVSIKKYPHEKLGKVLNLKCPHCQDNSLTAQAIVNTYKILCHNPKCPRKGEKFSILSIVRYFEKDKKDYNAEQILKYLKKLLRIKVLTPEDKEKIFKLFDRYQKEGFSLTPDKRNDKEGIEEKWSQKEHRDINEWMEWIAMGLNVSVVTGQKSNLTPLDIDQEKIPKEVKKLLGKTLIHKGNRGYHILYRYAEGLRGTVKLSNCKVEVLGNGDKFTIAPSVVENVERKFVNDEEIADMPEELIKFLKKHLDIKAEKKDLSERIREEIQEEIYTNPLIAEGEGRNDLFIHLYGMYRNFLPKGQVEKVLKKLDKVICNPPLGDELNETIFGSGEKYIRFDNEEIMAQIREYLKEVIEADIKDMERVIIGNYQEGEQKAQFDKAIACLLRENIIQKRGRFIYLTKKLEWKIDLIDGAKPINFKIPYFDDLMYFMQGDVTVIGGVPGVGKTHVAMNIIQQLVKQKVKPIHYISLESGCYDSKTEILTNKGWKFFKDLDKTEKVATLNPKTKRIIYQKPINYFKYKYNNKMLSIQTRYLNLVITPNHKQPMYVHNTNSIKMYDAYSMPNHNVIPKIGKWYVNNLTYFTIPEITYKHYLGRHHKYMIVKKPSIKLSIKEWAKFLGLYLAEGSCDKYRINISQKIESKEIQSILNSLNFKYKYRNHNFIISNYNLTNYLKQFGKSYEKFIPKEIKESNSEIIKEFLEGYFLGDGCRMSNGQRYFFTTSKQLADDLQEIIMKIGFFANISIRKSKGTIGIGNYIRKHDLYMIGEIRNLKGCLALPKNRKWINYNDYVYDVEVSKHHILYVRRNGKTAWSGNSRFKKIALKLGLMEGDFMYAKCADPTKVELEDNAVTIIDWLCPKEYAYTDKIIGHFNEQLDKHLGILFLFVQLRKSNKEFLAKDLMEFFPAMVVKFLYDDDDGVFSHFDICKVRESQRKKRRFGSIPCKFDWDTNVLSRIDEIGEFDNKEMEKEFEEGKEEEPKKKNVKKIKPKKTGRKTGKKSKKK